MIEVRLTVEGDWIVFILRLLRDGDVELYMDATRDRFATRAWYRYDCDSHNTAAMEPVGRGDSPQMLADSALAVPAASSC